MDKTQEALKLALEALESCSAGDYSTGHVIHPSFDVETVNKAIEAIDALAEQPAQQQEPVAWVREHELPLAPGDAFSWVETFVHKTPLYTSPPNVPPSRASKPWVGLTDEEIQTIWRNSEHMAVNQVCRAIEAKLREKNT